MTSWAILRLDSLAYLLTVVSDLPDDYSDDRASAAPFTAPRRGIVWGSEALEWRMPSQKCGLGYPFWMPPCEFGANYCLSTYKVRVKYSCTPYGVLDCDARDVYTCNMGVGGLDRTANYCARIVQL